jgi:hypothetical protein
VRLTKALEVDGLAAGSGRKPLAPVDRVFVPAHESSRLCPHCACRKPRRRFSRVYGPYSKDGLSEGVELAGPRLDWNWGIGPFNWLFGTPHNEEPGGWYEVYVYAYCQNPACKVPREQVKHIARKFSRFRRAMHWLKARLISGIETVAPSD